MPFPINEANNGCSSYYFADHCLHVSGSEFLSQSSLANFACIQPHSTSSRLEIRPYESRIDEEDILVAQESGICIYRAPDGRWILKSSDTASPCRIEADEVYSQLYASITPKAEEKLPANQDSFLQLLRTAEESFLCSRGGLSVHAACVKHMGKAVLFTAPSGTGKSTQADLWIRSLGASLISGDRPHLSIFPSEIRAYGVPWDGKEQQFSQDFAPVSAIVEIRQARENRIRVLSPEQAFRVLIKQTFIPMWDDQAKFLAIRSIRDIANRVPFYRLFCNMDDEAAIVLESVVFQQNKDKLERQEKDMKIKEGFILRNIVDEWIVMPKGTNIKTFEGAVVLNEVSAHIWRQLEKPLSYPDLLQSVLDEFDVSEEAARTDLDVFLNRLRENDLLTEE